MGYTLNLAPPRLANKVIMTKHAILIGKGGNGLCRNKIEIIKGFKDNNQIIGLIFGRGNKNMFQKKGITPTGTSQQINGSMIGCLNEMVIQ